MGRADSLGSLARLVHAQIISCSKAQQLNVALLNCVISSTQSVFKLAESGKVKIAFKSIIWVSSNSIERDGVNGII